MLYTLLPGDMMERYGVGVCTGYGMLIGGVVLFFLTRAWRIHVALDLETALGVAVIALLGTALAFRLYLQGVHDIGGVRASLLAGTEPLSAALTAGVWLGTPFVLQDLLGLALILAMAAVIAQPEKKKLPAQPKD